MMIQKNCAACGILFYTRLADHKRGWGKCCDKSCSAAFKVGLRPRDVNERYAKRSAWADVCLTVRKAAGVKEWPKAPSVKDQIGQNVKIKPIYHSPSSCRHCGKPVNGPGLCDPCEQHEDAMNSMEMGWDGHKAWA
ncbi:hypothetical protein RI570_21355 [Brucella pseudogrignonensis]|uniref:hypothetical protein n=1 Tax=Brucella pseudogrignonensis TaxID=419475 RepID=UPI0028B83DEC|nr:hypothetical protein [Brucella pseudogrignonensis]MDT6940777.1 hypothetical protein [Brucella pseudogrignonensis]MDT6942600.1 hypothetical protein [Brucella pseudogrignonensis]